MCYCSCAEMSEHKPAQAGKKNWLLGVKVSKKSGFIASLHAHSRQNDIWQLFVNHRRNLLFFLPLYLFMTGSKCESLEIVFENYVQNIYSSYQKVSETLNFYVAKIHFVLFLLKK